MPDRPVVVDCYDGHSIWVNSRALALAHITRETPDIREGAAVVGIIVRDPATGEPTGVLKEQAAHLVRDVIPAPTREKKLQALRARIEGSEPPRRDQRGERQRQPWRRWSCTPNSAAAAS